MRNHLFAIAAVTACIVATLAAQQPPDRSRPPAVGPPSALRLPPIQKRQLSNGLPVWLVELHAVPVVQVNLIVLSGTASDPTGKFGVASLAAAMLEEGAGSRSSLEISDALDVLGASLDASAGTDASGVRLHVPVARLADALPIMADVALRPTFPPNELERIRRERLTSVLQARDDPARIAAVAYSRVLFGANHRFGTPSYGTAESIRSLTRDDLRAFHDGRFRPRNAALIVVGDVNVERAMPLLESSFGGWAAAPPSAAEPLAPANQPTKRQVYLIDKPGAAQSHIRIGWIGVPRSTPDYFPIEVMNTILGGSFTSRLNTNLREQHGYTYSASSIFEMRVSAGPFVATAGVQTDKTAEALKEFFDELALIREPVPAEELTKATSYLSLRFPAEFETTGQVSLHLEEAIVHRLPDDYFSAYVPNVQEVTAADVQWMAQQYIDPDRFVVVIAGDVKAIESGVRALNLGPITLMTVDEVFGPAPVLGQ